MSWYPGMLLERFRARLSTQAGEEFAELDLEEAIKDLESAMHELYEARTYFDRRGDRRLVELTDRALNQVRLAKAAVQDVIGNLPVRR